MTGNATQTAGEIFARAIAAKDGVALTGILSETIDFQALTPGKIFAASTNTEAALELILGTWFAPARIDELCSVEASNVQRRQHVNYRFRTHLGDDEYLVEQQAYYDTDGGQITWMRVLCSGYQAVQPARLSARGSRRTGSPSPGWPSLSWRRCAPRDGWRSSPR